MHNGGGRGKSEVFLMIFEIIVDFFDFCEGGAFGFHGDGDAREEKIWGKMLFFALVQEII